MTPIGALKDTLDDIRRATIEFRDDWWIIGSAAAHLAGAETGAVQDVDLLLSAHDAESLKGVWRSAVLPAPPPHRQFRSNPFYRFQRALVVEAMANFEINTVAGWRPVRLRSRRVINGLAITEPAEQIELMTRMGRRKDEPRIAALKRLIA